MAKAYSYIVKRDYGFAPNPFYGVLTLATCKQVIRKGAGIGDIVIGNADSDNDHKLIYIAKVSEVLTYDQYWDDLRFSQKKPVMNGSRKKLYGDNIYHHGLGGEWIQEDSHHSNNDGTANLYNLERDTNTTDHVLVCNEFIYFGESMIDLPDAFEYCICRNRGHHCPPYDDAQGLWDYLIAKYPGGGMIALPQKFSSFERYDGVS